MPGAGESGLNFCKRQARKNILSVTMPPVLALLQTEQFRQNILWGWSRSTNHTEEGGRQGGRREEEKGEGGEEEAGFEGTKCREA